MAAPKPGGFKMSLGALKTKPGLKSSPAQKDTKKTKLLLGDDEPDDSNTQQEITGWDAAEGGAVDANGKKEKEGPRIIPALPNRDWRAEARRKQLAKAPHQQAQNVTVDESKMEEPKVQYGLTIIKKDEAQENGAAEAEAAEPMEVEQDNLTEEQRLEKKALDALISGKSTDNDLVIPVQSEEDALLNDLNNAPDAPTLEAYEATPIEGFGAALLRGMGWKDGDAIGKNGPAAKPKEVKRRPALLGIGAKEDAAIGVELGEWGGGKGKGKKVAQSYNPVTLRNKITGEMITEEELKAKLEAQSLIPDEKPSRSKSIYDDDSEDDERRREKRKEKRDDRDRDRDRRRDDDYDSERRKDKDRRRDKDDYYDSDRRRDKRRERTRDDDYDSERRREKRRERSRSPDDRKEKRRDRYRSRSRDSKRKSDRRDRSRSRDSDDRRRRRRDREYEDEERYEKRRRDDKYYK
ncbi:hypothetical protein J4E86_010314 [Alternaria arbusti]|uniref:uncharacterized protein n=1 Tax=Alternaria arbusti TaxID=232088 RepID=UPI0022205D8B|nr:uncharacterized protein J4E86_010314 [Alternaria arbusti]KAI4941803.1 hypothetical protein J4E86_010314 [Alternaria arbusti]